MRFVWLWYIGIRWCICGIICGMASRTGCITWLCLIPRNIRYDLVNPCIYIYFFSWHFGVYRLCFSAVCWRAWCLERVVPFAQMWAVQTFTPSVLHDSCKSWKQVTKETLLTRTQIYSSMTHCLIHALFKIVHTHSGIKTQENN